MVKKIYFGDKPLFIANNKRGELTAYLEDKKTMVLEKFNQAQLKDIIAVMDDNKTNAGIILHDVKDALEAIKKEFTVIQASGGLVHTNDNKILLIFIIKQPTY